MLRAVQWFMKFSGSCSSLVHVVQSLVQFSDSLWNSKADKIASRTLYATMHAESMEFQSRQNCISHTLCYNAQQPAIRTKLMRSPCKIYAMPGTLNAMTCKYHVVHTELMLSLICSQNLEQSYQDLQRQPLTLQPLNPGTRAWPAFHVSTCTCTLMCT